MATKPTLYTLREKIYHWSSQLDNIGESLPNHHPDKEQISKNGAGEEFVLETTIPKMNERLECALGDDMTSFVIKRQLKNIFGFACACYIVYWYLTLLDYGLNKTFSGVRVETLTNTEFSGFHVSYWFTSLIAPVIMIIGAFAHFDLKTGVSVSRVSSDNSMSQATMFERMGLLALLMNIYGGWLSGSILINLTTIPVSVEGHVGFGLSWLAVLYLTKTLGGRLGKLRYK